MRTINSAIQQPEIEKLGCPIRTTKNLALAALNTDEPVVPYVGFERQAASAIGTVLLLLLDAGMPNHHEYATPKTRFSVLSNQLMEAYNQLRFGTGKVEELFRQLFREKFHRHPEDVIDPRGDERRLKRRLKDAEALVRVVGKFSPWPEVADNFQQYVFDSDRQISVRFLTFYSTVLRPQMAGRVLVSGLHTKHHDSTNVAVLSMEQQGSEVKLMFGPRWGLRRGTIEFVGDIGDRCGETFKIKSSTLPVSKVLAALDSFNFRSEGMPVELDARRRALNSHGFKVVKNPKTQVPTLVNQASALA